MGISLDLVCVFGEREGEGGGGAPLIHGHKELYKDFNLKIGTSEWDSDPRTHEYSLTTELSGDLMSEPRNF